MRLTLGLKSCLVFLYDEHTVHEAHVSTQLKAESLNAVCVCAAAAVGCAII